MKRCTALPAAAVARLLGSGAVGGGGAAPPERVVPFEPFFEMLSERGIRVQTRWTQEPVAA
jgi:hypothetical protein